jgi:hypothetical protein
MVLIYFVKSDNESIVATVTVERRESSYQSIIYVSVVSLFASASIRITITSYSDRERPSSSSLLVMFFDDVCAMAGYCDWIRLPTCLLVIHTMPKVRHHT